MQKGDFKGIFREMKGLPVTIRLLDPPLHEFLPQKDEEIEEISQVVTVQHAPQGTAASRAAKTHLRLKHLPQHSTAAPCGTVGRCPRSGRPFVLVAVILDGALGTMVKDVPLHPLRNAAGGEAPQPFFFIGVP
jgi:hypothetical protein